MKINKNIACCFTGHRIIPNEKIYSLKQDLKFNIENLIINYNISEFIHGCAMGFDLMAAREVLNLRQKYHFIKLYSIVPYLNQTNGWHHNLKTEYNNILFNSDSVLVLNKRYNSQCLFERNRYMVDNSSHCIYYIERKKQNSGGTAYTVSYASKCNIILHNVENIQLTL